jgi:hypothetical protein
MEITVTINNKTKTNASKAFFDFILGEIMGLKIKKNK